MLGWILRMVLFMLRISKNSFQLKIQKIKVFTEAAVLLRPPVLFGNETVSLLESAGILWYDNECKRGTTSFRRKRPGRIKQGF